MRSCDHKIHNTDCITGMQKTPESSVDLVFADPPFNIGYDYDVYDDRLAVDEYLQWSREWIRQTWRALKPDGTFWLAIGDEFAAELKLAAQAVGYCCRSWVIWHYTFGVNCKNKFTRSHTHLFHFVKNPSQFTFRADDPENRIPSARLLKYKDKRGNPRGRLPDDTWQYSRVAGTFSERAGFHGCQMPEQLLGRIIRTCSNEGELVMDPFAGTASTLIVAKKLGRRAIGFEISEHYAQFGRERLDAASVGNSLAGSSPQSMAEFLEAQEGAKP